MNEYRNILTGDAARAWKRLAGRFYWLNDSEIAKHLIEVHDQWCGDQCPLVKSCDRGSSGYEMSCVKLEVPPSAKSEAENEDIPLQLEVDEGADSFVDNSSMTKSVDGECGFESDLDPVTYVFNVTDMEGDIKVVTDATDNTPQNTGSTLARTDNLIPASGNKSTDSRAGNLSQTLISVKQEPTDSGEYENFVGQDMETAESKTVHHSPPLTSSHPVSTNTISTAVRAALRQKISSTVDSLPLSTNKWTNSGGDTLTQAIPVVIQEPTDCGEYENSVIQSVETSHHHTQLTSSGATSHPVMSDTNIGVVKQEPTDCGEHENSVIQSVEPTQTKTISHHHSPLTSDFPTSLSVMSNNIVTSVKPSVTQGIPSTKAITLNPLVMGPRSLFPIIPGVNVAQTPCPAAPNPAVVGSQIVLPIAPHLSQTLAPGIAQTLAPGTAQTLNLATSGNVIYPQLLNVVRRGNSLYVAVPASTVTPDLQNPPFTFAASSLPPTIPMAANFLSNVGQGGSVALQPMLVPLSGVDLLSGGQQVSTSSTSLSGAGGEQTDGGCKQMDEKLTSTGATSHPVMSDSMTAALEPVPNHGTSSTNTHPGSLSPVVTGRQNTELATPDTNMDSTVTLATVADTLPPPRVLNIVTRIPASTVTCSSHSMGSTCLSISKSTPNMVADMTPNVNQTPMVVVKPMLVSPAQRVRLQSGGQQYLITKISRTGAGVEACMGKKRVAEDSLYTKPVKRRLTRKKQGPSTSKKSANISETETQSSEEDQSNQKEDQSIEKEDQSNNPTDAQWNGEQKETGSKKRGRPSVLSESERKRRRSVLNKRLSKQRIYLGAVKEEWNQLREALNLESNPDLAEFLINHHQQCQNVFASTSPPEKPQPHAKLEMSSTDEKENGRSIVRISEDFEEEEEEEEDSTPDLSLILGEKDHTDIEDVAGGNLVFGVGEMSLPEDKVGEMSLPEDRVGEMSHTEDRVGEMSLPEKEAAENVKVPGIMQILTMEESELVLRSEKVIVFEEQLLMLAKSKIDDQCLVKGCPEAVKISTRYVASALYLVWSCSNKHIKHRWCSQPLLSGGSQSGDLMITAAILCSGNDFCKVKRMADLLHLHFPSQSSFTQLQQKCLVPAIEETWFEHQRSERTKLNDKDVVLLGIPYFDTQERGNLYLLTTPFGRLG
ncbi:mucin-17-like isoform X2 [Ostrea edulis]|uniref:mucin-17-like isoform X2 n=1 Tax=Ostrea edulis TaxID=37623 RepID=UPI0024AF9A20|nr:mucin-17-like isoform X2 [Ostrea edulis]